MLSILLLGLAQSARILIVLDNWDIQATHSLYFDNLKEKHEVTVKMYDEDIPLQHWGEQLYEMIILMSPSAVKVGSNLDVNSFLSYFDKKGQLLVFGDTDAALFYRNLINQFGFDFYELGVRVYNNLQEKEVRTFNVTAPQVVADVRKEIRFTGTGLHMPKNPVLSYPALRASKTSIAQNELKNKEKLGVRGSDIIIMGGFQGNNNARMGVSSSLDICSNKYYEDTQLGNKQICDQFTSWILQEKGLLRFSDITHYRLDEDTKIGDKALGFQEQVYTLREQLYYQIYIEEWNNDSKKWIPFSNSNVYLEFIMLDPYIRKYLSRNGNKFYTQFKVPDKPGVYLLKTRFNEHGYTWINTGTKAPVRPHRHDDIERFMLAALPYYTTVGITVFSFVTFSYLFLYHLDTKN